MYLRCRPRWRTHFGRWVSDVGVSTIVSELGRDPMTAVSSQAVYQWLAGAHAPRPERARALVEMSGGRLSLEMIYDQRRAK